MSTVVDPVQDVQEAAGDALLNTAAIFIQSMATIAEHLGPMTHWDLPECVLKLDTRRCARVYLVSAKLNLEHIEYLRLLKFEMRTTLTEPQKLRAGPLYESLEKVAVMLKERVELLEKVLVRYDITEE